METLGVLFFVAVTAAVFFLVLLTKMIYVSLPNEILVFSGRYRKVKGRTVGYRFVKGGGRGIRIPLFEVVDRMDLSNMVIELSVKGAFSRGGIPLNVAGIANIKVAGEEPALGNAVEKLLGKSRQQINKLATETLEGNLRGVLSTLTPEQVNEDKIAFSKSLLEEAEEDLLKLGLHLDGLQIQNISDDVSYLNSIGRKQSADVVRKARIAEARARAAAAIQAAENQRQSTIAAIEAKKVTAQADAARRLTDAQTKRKAVVAEERAKVAAQVARMKADVDVQKARIEKTRSQLEADTVRPAEARKAKMQADARADAATIVEEGRATVEGLRETIRSWEAAGEHARQAVLLQKLEPLLATITSTVPNLVVDRFTVVDDAITRSNGGGIGGGTALKAAVAIEQLRDATGIDIAGLFGGKGKGGDDDGGGGGKPAPRLPSFDLPPAPPSGGQPTIQPPGQPTVLDRAMRQAREQAPVQQDPRRLRRRRHQG